MTTLIHVSTAAIGRNSHVQGPHEPTLEIRRGTQIEMAHQIEILGPARIVYRPHSPLSSGARVWIETESEVKALPAEPAPSP